MVYIMSLVRIVGIVLHPLGILDEVRPEVERLTGFFILEIDPEINDVSGLVYRIIAQVGGIVFPHICFDIFQQGNIFERVLL